MTVAEGPREAPEDGGGAAASPRFLVRVDRPDELAAYLRGRGWLEPDEPILTVAPAGDGNMNCTLRVVTARRRFVVKQGRPWVEKYPEIPAPGDRTAIEASFYGRVRGVTGVADQMPALLGFDAGSYVLLLEDCDGFADLTTDVYAHRRIGDDLIGQLLGYLHGLHRMPAGEIARTSFRNDAMRSLNHEYIFCLPLSNQAALHERLERITPGLPGAAREFAGDDRYAARVRTLGETYLHGEARALVHGDFFPGSWLSDGTRVKVIDPEFCFAGAPEFDYGVMAAHLVLGGQDVPVVGRVTAVADAAGCDARLVAGFAGVEIVRRVLGVAQLPRLERTLREKVDLLRVAHDMVCGEKRTDRAWTRTPAVADEGPCGRTRSTGRAPRRVGPPRPKSRCR